MPRRPKSKQSPGESLHARVARAVGSVGGLEPKEAERLAPAFSTILGAANGSLALRSQVGPLLRQLRKEQGLSQTVLAQRLGVTARTIQRWEAADSTIDLAELEVAGRVLGIRLLLVAMPLTE